MKYVNEWCIAIILVFTLMVDVISAIEPVLPAGRPKPHATALKKENDPTDGDMTDFPLTDVA